PPGRRGGRRHVGRLGALGARVPVLCQLAAQAPARDDARWGCTARMARHRPPSHARAGASRARRRGPPRRPGAAFRAAARGEVASVVDREGVTRPPLLLYLASAGDPQRFAIAPALAALAERRGWEFELYYAAYRAGRHFGGGRPEEAAPGWPAGSLAAGGRHADHARRLAESYDVVFVGDPRSPLVCGLGRAEGLAPTSDPLAIYTIAFERLGEPLPELVFVVDATPAGPNGLVIAPYLYPAF